MMRRRLPNFVTALSLLLCAATLVLWVRSRFVEDLLLWRRVDGARWVVSSPGAVIFGIELANWSAWTTDSHGLHYERGPASPTAQHLARMLLLGVGPNDKFEYWTAAGFGWYRWRPASHASHFARLVVPLWAVTVVTAALPAFRVARALRGRRPGVCAACGYDLRATPGRCPECGTAAADPAAPRSRGLR